MDDKRFHEMFAAFKDSHGVRDFSSKDLADWLNFVDTPDERIHFFARKIEYELQRRRVLESIIWQKWMAIATAIMAFATIILAIITFLKN